jgi:hypothetical protein
MVGFPLLLIPLAIYNIIVLLMPDVSFTDPLVRLTLVSGAEWTVTLSDVLLTLGILLLLAEVIKGARPGAKYLTDHLLSLIVFGAAAAEFVMWPKFATSTYFLMTLLAMVDFLSGLALRTRRRAVVAAASPVPSKRGARVETAEAEPAPSPAAPVAPAPPRAEPSVPAAASVAESVLTDRPEPKIVETKAEKAGEPVKPAEHAEPASHPVAPAAPPAAFSPEVPSPGLQPNSPASPDKPETPQR